MSTQPKFIPGSKSTMVGGKEAPKGFVPIPGSKHGGWRKRVGAKWVYWYPSATFGLEFEALREKVAAVTSQKATAHQMLKQALPKEAVGASAGATKASIALDSPQVWVESLVSETAATSNRFLINVLGTADGARFTPDSVSGNTFVSTVSGHTYSVTRDPSWNAYTITRTDNTGGSPTTLTAEGVPLSILQAFMSTWVTDPAEVVGGTFEEWESEKVLFSGADGVTSVIKKPLLLSAPLLKGKASQLKAAKGLAALASAVAVASVATTVAPKSPKKVKPADVLAAAKAPDAPEQVVEAAAKISTAQDLDEQISKTLAKVEAYGSALSKLRKGLWQAVRDKFGSDPDFANQDGTQKKKQIYAEELRWLKSAEGRALVTEANLTKWDYSKSYAAFQASGQAPAAAPLVAGDDDITKMGTGTGSAWDALRKELLLGIEQQPHILDEGALDRVALAWRTVDPSLTSDTVNARLARALADYGFTTGAPLGAKHAATFLTGDMSRAVALAKTLVDAKWLQGPVSIPEIATITHSVEANKASLSYSTLTDSEIEYYASVPDPVSFVKRNRFHTIQDLHYAMDVAEQQIQMVADYNDAEPWRLIKKALRKELLLAESPKTAGGVAPVKAAFKDVSVLLLKSAIKVSDQLKGVEEFHADAAANEAAAKLLKKKSPASLVRHLGSEGYQKVKEIATASSSTIGVDDLFGRITAILPGSMTAKLDFAGHGMLSFENLDAVSRLKDDVLLGRELSKADLTKIRNTRFALFDLRDAPMDNPDLLNLLKHEVSPWDVGRRVSRRLIQSTTDLSIALKDITKAVDVLKDSTTEVGKKAFAAAEEVRSTLAEWYATRSDPDTVTASARLQNFLQLQLEEHQIRVKAEAKANIAELDALQKSAITAKATAVAAAQSAKPAKTKGGDTGKLAHGRAGLDELRSAVEKLASTKPELIQYKTVIGPDGGRYMAGDFGFPDLTPEYKVQLVAAARVLNTLTKLHGGQVAASDVDPAFTKQDKLYQDLSQQHGIPFEALADVGAATFGLTNGHVVGIHFPDIAASAASKTHYTRANAVLNIVSTYQDNKGKAVNKLPPTVWRYLQMAPSAIAAHTAGAVLPIEAPVSFSRNQFEHGVGVPTGIGEPTKAVVYVLPDPKQGFNVENLSVYSQETETIMSGSFGIEEVWEGNSSDHPLLKNQPGRSHKNLHATYVILRQLQQEEKAVLGLEKGGPIWRPMPLRARAVVAWSTLVGAMSDAARLGAGVPLSSLDSAAPGSVFDDPETLESTESLAKGGWASKRARDVSRRLAQLEAIKVGGDVIDLPETIAKPAIEVQLQRLLRVWKARGLDKTSDDKQVQHLIRSNNFKKAVDVMSNLIEAMNPPAGFRPFGGVHGAWVKMKGGEAVQYWKAGKLMTPDVFGEQFLGEFNPNNRIEASARSGNDIETALGELVDEPDEGAEKPRPTINRAVPGYGVPVLDGVTLQDMFNVNGGGSFRQ